MQQAIDSIWHKVQSSSLFCLMIVNMSNLLLRERRGKGGVYYSYKVEKVTTARHTAKVVV